MHTVNDMNGNSKGKSEYYDNIFEDFESKEGKTLEYSLSKGSINEIFN